MPRIANIGEFDWNPSRPISPVEVRFSLHLDPGRQVPENHAHSEAVFFEVGVNKKVWSYEIDSFVDFDYDTKSLTSLQRELGRFLSIHFNSSCTVSSYYKDNGAVVYYWMERRIGFPEIRHMTRFIISLSGKIEKWIKRCCLDVGDIAVLDQKTLQKTIHDKSIYSWAGCDPETAERFVLKLRERTSQKVEWCTSGHADKYQGPLRYYKKGGLGFLHTTGNEKVIKKAIEDLSPEFFK